MFGHDVHERRSWLCLALLLWSVSSYLRPVTAQTSAALHQTQRASAAEALLQGKYAESESLYRSLVEREAPSGSDRKGLALALHMQGKESAALSVLSPLTKEQSDTSVWVLRASASCRLAQYPLAADALSHLDPLPKDPTVLAEVAECTLLAGDPLTAVEVYQRLVDAGEQPRDMYAVGLAQSEIQASKAVLDRLQKRSDAAEYRAALDAASTSSTALQQAFEHARGAVPGLLSDEMSVEQMKRVLRLNGTSSAAIFGVGIVLGRRGITAFTAAQAQYPDSPYPLAFKAQMMLAAKRDQEAIGLYRDILASHPDYPGVHFQIGSILGSDGDWAAALGEYREQQRLTPSDERTLRAIAICLIDSSQFEELYATLAEPAKSKDAPQWLLVDFATSQENTGRQKESIATLKRLEQLDPENAKIHYRLSQLYRGENQNELAQEELARFKKLKHDQPSDAPAK